MKVVVVSHSIDTVSSKTAEPEKLEHLLEISRPGCYVKILREVTLLNPLPFLAEPDRTGFSKGS